MTRPLLLIFPLLWLLLAGVIHAYLASPASGDGRILCRRALLLFFSQSRTAARQELSTSISRSALAPAEMLTSVNAAQPTAP